jgi:hypothetical protein
MPREEENSVSFQNPTFRREVKTRNNQSSLPRTRSSLSSHANIPYLGDEVVINRKRRGAAYKQPSVKLAMRYKVRKKMNRIINYVLSLLALLFLELSFDNNDNESKHLWHDTTTTTAIDTLVYLTLSSLLQTHTHTLSLSHTHTASSSP